jgi:hypothetical protein
MARRLQRGMVICSDSVLLPPQRAPPQCALSSDALPSQLTPSPLPLNLRDEATHTSVYDGARASRVASHMRSPFAHSDMCALHQTPSPRSFPFVVPVNSQNRLRCHD